MSLVRWIQKTAERNRRSRKAISTIMANLTMLVIVVVLSSLLFVWAITSFGAYQGGAGYWFSSRSIANQERPTVENVFFTNAGCSGPCAKIFVRNVGTIPFTVSSVYVNSTLTNYNSIINVTQVLPFSVPVTVGGGTWKPGSVQTITIATLRGTVITAQWVS
ncbi:MAG TPA: hypothetical protein VFE98_02480 [Candidatus Bathyarchaeia archaeon]|nr:hypothetical protein [Candidatus Bathyarchaeia archaeon]